MSKEKVFLPVGTVVHLDVVSADEIAVLFNGRSDALFVLLIDGIRELCKRSPSLCLTIPDAILSLVFED